MSTIIKFNLKELRKLANDKNSCVVEKKVTQNLALQPWCLGNLQESIKNLLDYKIGKFDKELNGILLSYKNLRVLTNVGAIRNDGSDIQFQVQADYFIFQPYVGATLKGLVNKKSNTHLGILVHRVFNVVIPRPTEEPGNEWIGSAVQEGQVVLFRVVVLDLFGALPYIRGELDERWVKLGPDDDDEMFETKQVEPVTVDYVNFDKIKPLYQRQSGDGIQSPTKSLLKTDKPHSVSKNQPKSAAQVSKEKNGVSGSTSKKNMKKLSKTSDADATSSATRPSKKQKRES
ncbi:DNA-directed RNA polymerase I subunit RPA43 [Leguminivora glycinivorella]|uniref:DNA-directed RNA polymerase I subunit RPA43 n=1 Tax=Leguminivora glycinivorella TaxID=1035111 RepID=UPI00200C895F|nr:DNA-directed RNA polymerase I subunit RPA43 [Leguminivora glycinivorella]